MPRSLFPEMGIRATEKNGKGYTEPGGESVRTPEAFARKGTWQVADVRRLLVSASHII